MDHLHSRENVIDAGVNCDQRGRRSMDDVRPRRCWRERISEAPACWPGRNHRGRRARGPLRGRSNLGFLRAKHSLVPRAEPGADQAEHKGGEQRPRSGRYALGRFLDAASPPLIGLGEKRLRVALHPRAPLRRLVVGQPVLRSDKRDQSVAVRVRRLTNARAANQRKRSSRSSRRNYQHLARGGDPPPRMSPILSANPLRASVGRSDQAVFGD